MMYGTTVVGKAHERFRDRCRMHGIDGGALHWDAVGHVACGTIADG